MKITDFITEGVSVSVNISAVDLRAAFCQWAKEAASTDELPSKMILTPKEVCELLGITRQTLLRWNMSGYLKPVKIGGQYRYQKKDIDKLLGQ